MSPGGRFALVLALIAALHAGGAVASRSSAGLSATLHAVGTAAFGAGIYLAGPDLPHGGALAGGAHAVVTSVRRSASYLLRQWPQVLWLAVLVPAWLWGEWTAALPPHAVWRGLTPVAVGMFLLACAYLMARPADSTERWRRALAWLGAIALIPAGRGARDVERRRLDDVRRAVPGGDRRAAHRRLVGCDRAAARARVVPARARRRLAARGARLGARR